MGRLIPVLLFFISFSGWTQTASHILAEVDSIVWLRTTDKQFPTLDQANTIRAAYGKSSWDSTTYAMTRMNFFRKVDDFATLDHEEGIGLYSRTKSFHSPQHIKEIKALFPKVTCTEFPAHRCPPTFRDLVLCYKKGTLIQAVRICFECSALDSTVTTENLQCLRNETYVHEMFAFLINHELINLYDE